MTSSSDLSPLHPDRNLALELVRATEAAAIRAVPFIGRGDKEAADGAAVDAMRAFFSTVNFDGRIVIGEGEKDEAPMLYNGEKVGSGRGPRADVAVDPIDGTTLTAGDNRTRCRLSPSPTPVRCSTRPPSSTWTSSSPGPLASASSTSAPPVGENIRRLAAALGKPVDEMVVSY